MNCFLKGKRSLSRPGQGQKYHLTVAGFLTEVELFEVMNILNKADMLNGIFSIFCSFFSLSFKKGLIFAEVY